MGRYNKRNDLPQEIDESKPCRCKTGFYCHRHLRYGMGLPEAQAGATISKKVKIKRSPKPKGNTSAGGQH